MSKIAKELSPLEVKRLTHPQDRKGAVSYNVGGIAGLRLQITKSGSKSWVLRISVDKKVREMGLGSYPEVTLAESRDRARDARGDVYKGEDPLAKREAARAAAKRSGFNFTDAINAYAEAKLIEFKSIAYREQWRRTMAKHAEPKLGTILVQDITPQDVLRTVQPIWLTTTETAMRLRGRIENVLDWSTAHGYRTGDNPARWKGNLKEMLPEPSKIAPVVHRPAIQFDDAARWFGQLRKRDGMGSRALEFIALTASRSGEVRGARWDEVDFVKGLWEIPAARMKMSRPHRVPLSVAATTLLEALPRENELIFPAIRGGMLSDMTVSATMERMHNADLKAGGDGYFDSVSKRRAVPHGLRSTFRDWAAETTDFDGAMVELALAHKVANNVEAAYRRGDMLEKRRNLMDAWASHLKGKSVGPFNVVQLGAF